MPGSEPVTIITNLLGSSERSDALQVLCGALGGRVFGLHSHIASGLLRGAEGLAVSPKRPALCSPPVKQPWIVRELQQRRSNFLRFRHTFVHGIKASFFGCTSRISRVSQALDIPMAHMKSHLSDI